MMNSQYNTVLYQAENAANGKKYIGITSVGLTKREKRHRTWARYKHGAVFGAALCKYGESIKFSVLAVCPDLAYAKQMEIAAISAFKPEYNLTEGGDGCNGYRHTEDHKKRVGDLHRGNKRLVGRKHLAETIQKMKESAGKHRRKAVVSMPDGVRFDSQILAAKAYGITPAYVCLLCKTGGKTTSGLRFALVTEA